MSFSDQIAGITSLSIGTTPTNDEVSQFLVDGTKDVVNRIISIRPDEIMKFTASDHDANNSGIVIQGQVVGVVREHDSATILRPCSPMDAQNRYEATDSTSLQYRSKYNPGFYELNGRVFTVPASATSNNDSIVTHVYYATNTGYNGTSIDNFPDEYEYLVVLYASAQSMLAYIGNIDSELPSNLSLPTVPTSPTLSTITESLPTWTSPSGLVLPVAPADADVDLSTVTAPSAFVAPTVSLDTTLGGTDLTISAIAPIPPSLSDSSISFSETTTYNPPVIILSEFPTLTWNFPSVPIAPAIAAGSVTITGTPPTYTSPILNLSTIPSLTWTMPSTPLPPLLSDNSIASLGTAPIYTKPTAVPDLPGIDVQVTADDPEMADVIRGKAGLQLSQYQSDIQNELNNFNKLNAEYQAELQKKIQDGQLGSKDDDQALQKYSAEVQYYSSEVASIVQANQGQLSVWQQENAINIQKYTANIQDALNNFNKENVEYQAKLQKDIQDSQLTDGELAKKLQRYSAETQTYSAEVAKVIQANQGELSEWQNESSLLVQKYTADLSNSLNQFNKTQIEYQGELTRVTQEAQLISGDDSQKIQLYGSELQSYTASVNKEVQEYTVNSINRDLAEWGANNTNALTEYTSKIQIESSRYSSELGLYSQDIQKLLQKYQAETGYDVAKYSAEVQARIQDVANALQLETASHTAAINEYSADISNITQSNQSKLGKYSAESQNYAAEAQSELADFNAKIQKLNAKYQWAHGRYVALKQEYNDAFGILAPPKQQGR